LVSFVLAGEEEEDEEEDVDNKPDDDEFEAHKSLIVIELSVFIFIG
jgi:hypothetical protein